MILLKANPELQQTFEKLILTMKVPVKWNGIFAVIDNYIILQGEVRSLFFHFDSRKVVTNIIDLPVKGEEIQDTAENIRVRNVINMILYVFGKWGTIKGLKVERNYTQLNQLFQGIMKELYVEPEYTQDYFRFYKEGIRITYEDVIQTALEAADEIPPETEDEVRGLWHKVVWKKTEANFSRVDTVLSERLKGRLGNNFYMVGYLCPVCHQKLYMVVYPVNKEFRIETEEGAVLLARACACDRCNSFYTPRPGKLLSEGDVYTMQFEDDRKAYEDYLELLGRKGERVSNHGCNRFAEQRDSDDEGKEEEEEDLDELCKDLEDYSEEELKRIAEYMEEGFYPDKSILRCEDRVKEYRKRRAKGGSRTGNQELLKSKCGEPEHYAAGEAAKTKKEVSFTRGERAREAGGSRNGKNIHAEAEFAGNSPKASSVADKVQEAPADALEQEKVCQRYEAKLNVCERFSERQLRELRNQLEKEKHLAPDIKREFLEKVEHRLACEGAKELGKKVDSCEGKNYAVLKRVREEVLEAELPKEIKQPFLDKLNEWMKNQGGQEVEQLVSKMSPRMDRGQYRSFMEKLHTYTDVDLSPYEDKFRSSREAAEKQEIAEVVRRARKNTRGDLAELAEKLRGGDFLPELVKPYLEKVEGRIRQLDEDAIAEVCADTAHMAFEEAMEAYEQMEQGEFLPELKANALEMLEKRLAKIKTDESELLVKKLTEELAEAGINQNLHHYFYPARKVLLNQAEPSETDVIDYAVASYAAGRGRFEYPIFVVDTSRNESGKEGMILTPDHLYYSTLLTAYGIPVASIDKITASTGLLNKGIYVHQKNGTKTKVPHAVENKELQTYAGVLNEFIHYLQEKPDSRKVTYLAREKHETICCFRCGYVYKEGNICPKCGYKSNG